MDLAIEQLAALELVQSQRFTRILKRKTADAARRWCFATGQRPEPRLAEAFEQALELLLGSAAAAHANWAELGPSMRQLNRFLAQFQTPAEMLEAIGLGQWTDAASEALASQPGSGAGVGGAA